jgi:hypothetical protein
MYVCMYACMHVLCIYACVCMLHSTEVMKIQITPAILQLDGGYAWQGLVRSSYSWDVCRVKQEVCLHIDHL